MKQPSMHSAVNQFASLAGPMFHPFSYAAAFRPIDMPIHPAFLPAAYTNSAVAAAAMQSAARVAEQSSKRRSFTIDAILGHDRDEEGSQKEDSDSEISKHESIRRQQRQLEAHPYLASLACNPGLRFPTAHNPISNKDKCDKVNKGQEWKPTKSKRVRTIFTPEQLDRLEAEFERQQYMVGTERYYLASALNLTEAQVKVWFQNRRIKWRKQNLEQQQAKLAKLNLLKQTESDSESDSDGDVREQHVMTAHVQSPVSHSPTLRIGEYEDIERIHCHSDDELS